MSLRVDSLLRLGEQRIRQALSTRAKRTGFHTQYGHVHVTQF
jgi:hypothetical protein